MSGGTQGQLPLPRRHPSLLAPGPSIMIDNFENHRLKSKKKMGLGRNLLKKANVCTSFSR